MRNSAPDIDRFTARFSRSNRAIPVDFRKLVRDLGTPDRATHFLHPYPAKLLVQIPYFFLSNDVLSKKGDRILDPFSGSGTVMLESIIAQRKGFGAESNPLARLISEVKTTPLCPALLKRTLREITHEWGNDSSVAIPELVNPAHWFLPNAIEQLGQLSYRIRKISEVSVRDFFRLCLSKTASKVSLADPRISVPVRLRQEKYPKGSKYYEKIERHLKNLEGINVTDVFQRIADDNISRMTNLRELVSQRASAEIVSEDARRLHPKQTEYKGLRSSSINLIITSPPYPGAQKYVRASTFGLGWLELCCPSDMTALKRQTIGREEFRKAEYSICPSIGISSADKKIQKIYAGNKVRASVAGVYLNEMREALEEMWRVLVDDGHLVLIASNNEIAGANFPTARYLREIAESVGFKTKFVLYDEINSRGLMTKRNKTASVIAREYVMLLSKVKK